MPNWERGKPTGLSVGPDGNVYIADTHYARVAVYSPNGKFLKDWGSFGREPGQFIYPTDVAFDKAGNIYVSEYGDNDRIQVFDPNTLKVLRTIGKFGQGDGEFARPQSMVIDDDILYVTDSCNHRISVFSINGTFLHHIGCIGTALGQFRFPYGLDEDHSGHLIVAEFGNNRIQLIDKKTGKGLATWGVAGREIGQLAYPWPPPWIAMAGSLRWTPGTIVCRCSDFNGSTMMPMRSVLAWWIDLEFMPGWKAALIFLALAAPIVLLGIRSLAGMGPVRKWVAIVLRLMVLLMLVLILAGRAGSAFTRMCRSWWCVTTASPRIMSAIFRGGIWMNRSRITCASPPTINTRPIATIASASSASIARR